MHRSRMVCRYTTTLSLVCHPLRRLRIGSLLTQNLGTGVIAQAGSWILVAIVWGAVFSNPVILFSAHPVRLLDFETWAMLTRLFCSCSTPPQSYSSPKASSSSNPHTLLSRRSTVPGPTPDSTILPFQLVSLVLSSLSTTRLPTMAHTL